MEDGLCLRTILSRIPVDSTMSDSIEKLTGIREKQRVRKYSGYGRRRDDRSRFVLICTRFPIVVSKSKGVKSVTDGRDTPSSPGRRYVDLTGGM